MAILYETDLVCGSDASIQNWSSIFNEMKPYMQDTGDDEWTFKPEYSSKIIYNNITYTYRYFEFIFRGTSLVYENGSSSISLLCYAQQSVGKILDEDRTPPYLTDMTVHLTIEGDAPTLGEKFLSLVGLTYLWGKITNLLNTKQNTLVSGTNIKTVNNNSLLGSGNIDIQGGGGDIFVAEYDVATFQEVDTAYKAGKYIAVKDSQGVLYGAKTTCVKDSQQNDKYIMICISESDSYVFMLDQTNGWTMETTKPFMLSFLFSTRGDILVADGTGQAIDSGAKISDLQWKLVSGTNIKTINNNSLLGSGNIDIQGGGGMALVDDPTNGHLLTTDATGQAQDAGVSLDAYYTKLETDTLLDDKVDTTDIASDNALGLVKTNSSQSISVDANGVLSVGGRLGQFSSQDVPNGGVFYPTAIEPTNVGPSTFLMSDGAKFLSLGGRTFGIMAGVNLTCKSASAGATQYRLSNNQSNRFSCFACRGGRLAIDQADATANGTALMTDISFANGNPISAYFGPTESGNDIIITVDRTVNPSAKTTKLRMYGTSTSTDVIIAGQGNGASGGKAISLGQACHAGGNQCIAFGNSSLSLANNSVALGHTQLVNKQFCFAAGQGHDFTNAPNGSAAVGIASLMDSNTLFAVGNGIFNSNGNITRSNAFEVTNDGGIVLKSPNGTRYKITVDDSGNLSTSAIA